MNSQIPEYTVYVPKGDVVNTSDINNINKFVVKPEDYNLVFEEIPSFNAWYALICNADWGFPLQCSDKLNILKIPWGKDHSVWLAHLLSRLYNHKDSSHKKDIRFGAVSWSEDPIINMLGKKYRPELIRDLQLISHDPLLEKSLITNLQLDNQKIGRWLRKILSMSQPTWWEGITWKDIKELFVELFRWSHSSWDNAVRECWEETGKLMNKLHSKDPYLIINQLKTPSKRWPIIKKYSFYNYNGTVDDLGTIKPSISEAEYDFYLKNYDSANEASDEAFTKIENKISQWDWYKMPIWLINARALQHAPKK